GAGTHFDPKVVEAFIKHLAGFEEQIAVRGLQPQGHRPDWPEPLRMFEVDIAQSRERGCYIAYDQIKNAHSEGYALYDIAPTFACACLRQSPGLPLTHWQMPCSTPGRNRTL